MSLIVEAHTRVYMQSSVPSADNSQGDTANYNAAWPEDLFPWPVECRPSLLITLLSQVWALQRQNEADAPVMPAPDGAIT